MSEWRVGFAHRIGACAVLGAAAWVWLPAQADAGTTVFGYAVSSAADPLLSNLTIPANAATQGMWSTTYPWPLVGLHETVMPDGRVLTFGTPDGQGVQDGRTLDIWDPLLGLAPSSHLQIANGQLVDSFCATAAVLPGSGTVLVSGGASNVDGYTSYASTAVTPSASTAVNVNESLAAQRWYATMITLADGRPMIAGGGTPYAIVSGYQNPSASLPSISITPEVFTPGSGWSSLMGASSADAFGPTNNRGWYPRMWVAPNGQVFGISTDLMWSVDAVNNAITELGNFKTTVNNTTLPNVGPTSTAVMYDVGKILQVGGNGYNNGYPSPSSPFATTFDINGSTPVVQDTAPMNYPRQWANSLVMPDGNVLVTGGSTYADNAGSNAVYPAELWNPKTGKWTVEASAANYRGYHSATALLPDGAVLSTGGGVPGPVTNLNAEVYYPPYLFQQSGNASVLAPRPQIVSISTTTAQYADTIGLQIANSTPIVEASLIGLSATTHSFNTFQRRMTLALTQSGNTATVTMPNLASLAPPGYYLLTVLNAARVPSAGVIIALHAAPVPQSSVTAILPIDGAVRSIASTIAPGNVIRHQNFNAYMNPITPQSVQLDRDDSSFYTRPGLASSACYSFESKNYPGYFLRHQYFVLHLQRNDGSGGFASDSTFCATAGLSGVGYSLQPINFPTYYVHNRNNAIGIDQSDGSTQFAQNASFYFAEQYLPVDANLHAFGNLTQQGTLVRHQNFQAVLSSINAASAPQDMADSSFHVLPGNANASCYSFGASNYPGYFLRHQNFVLYLQQNDGSSGFAQDSTFCLQAGLGGQGFSLTAINFPNYYLRQNNYAIYLNQSDGSAQFQSDATFSLLPAP